MVVAQIRLMIGRWHGVLPGFVPNEIADQNHGNKVTAITVQGHVWNPGLSLPKLFCQIGTVQAIMVPSDEYAYDPMALIPYVKGIIGAHEDTRVWNMSFNVDDACDSNQVSFFGHEITRLARRYNILPVISAGNKSPENNSHIAPPADCEAALVVGGRKPNDQGKPGAAWDGSLPGPGPGGMLKPDLSWYSTLQIAGGEEVTGTSYAAPLVFVPFCPCVSKFEGSYSRLGEGTNTKQNRGRGIRSRVRLGVTE